MVEYSSNFNKTRRKIKTRPEADQKEKMKNSPVCFRISTVMHAIAPPWFNQIHSVIIIEREEEKQDREWIDRKGKICNRHIK